MATSFMSLVNGIGRMFPAPGTTPLYDQVLSVISGTPVDSTQIQGPVTAGTSVTLPNSGTYTGAELQVELNGQGLEPVTDYAYVGSGTSKTQVQFTFGLVVGDTIDFRIVRSL